MDTSCHDSVIINSVERYVDEFSTLNFDFNKRLILYEISLVSAALIFNPGFKYPCLVPYFASDKLCVAFALPSISSTFYASVFRTKFWRQKSQSQTYLEKSCSICFGTKNARVKCWWNLLLKSEIPNFKKMLSSNTFWKST